MKAQFLSWWRERSLREQRLLLAMFALLAVTFLWLGLYRPIEDALARARARHQEAAVRLGEARLQVEALRVSRGKRMPVPAPLAPWVTEAAAQAGFANATVAPQGDRRVSVSIPSARPAPVLSWIATMEEQGIVIERFSARQNSDPTLAVDMTLAGGN